MRRSPRSVVPHAKVRLVVGGDSIVNSYWLSTFVWYNSMSDSDSRCYLGQHEVFVALEKKRLCKFVSLVMVWPGEQYLSGAFQAQYSSAYSS